MLKLTKTLSKWLIALTAISTVLVGCNKDLKDDINELKDRVNSLEVVTSQLESAINSGKLISSVTPDRTSTRLNSSHIQQTRIPSLA